MEETKGKLKERKRKQALFYNKIDHVIRHTTICLKNLKIDKTGGGFKYHFSFHSNKFLSLHVWNDSALHFNKKTEQKHHFNAQN